MAPHIEEFRLLSAKGDESHGRWEVVPNSEHRTNDMSLSTLLCHAAVKLVPKKFREVDDRSGAVCDGMQTPAPVTAQNIEGPNGSDSGQTSVE